MVGVGIQDGREETLQTSNVSMVLGLSLVYLVLLGISSSDLIVAIVVDLSSSSYDYGLVAHRPPAAAPGPPLRPLELPDAGHYHVPEGGGESHTKTLGTQDLVWSRLKSG